MWPESEQSFPSATQGNSRGLRISGSRVTHAGGSMTSPDSTIDRISMPPVVPRSYSEIMASCDDG